MKYALLLWIAVWPVAAQPKKLVDAQVQTRTVAGGLDKMLQSLASTQPQPAWAAYAVPAARGRNFGCDQYWRDNEFAVAGGVVHLEPPREVMVLFRFNNNQVSQIRTLAPDCEMSAGGAPFYWLNGVEAAGSVAALSGLVKPGSRLAESAVNAIGLHAGPAADAALEKFLSRDHADSIRAAAVRWIGTTRGRRGLELLKPILASDPSERMRKSVIHSLAASSDPVAFGMLAGAGKGDETPSVRSEALRSLARKGGGKALAALQSSIENEASRDVRREAVFALRSFPDGEGVPALIQTARSHRDAEVRKHAMTALGQSKDSRAVAFFEDVLRTR